MKKILLSIAALNLITISAFSQRPNTFPSTGGVGIGTTTPSELLHFQDNEPNIRLGSIANATGYVGEFASVRFFKHSDAYLAAKIYSYNDYSIHSYYGGDLRFATTDNLNHTSDRLTIAYNGSIGIGTTAPSTSNMLQINAGGNASVALRLEIGKFSMGGSANLEVDANGVVGGRFFVGTNGTGIGTNNPRTTLDVKGKVVIGTRQTTATDYQLSVDGKIYCQEIDVTPSTQWADYVFKKDYALPTLEAVETHIKEKGHLKDVPPAEEVAKTGYKVGEMDATLLMKIEELTLYVIELKKENQNIKQEILTIKNK